MTDDSPPLPPLRKKVFLLSLQIVGLYVVVGGLMMAAVFLASGITPKAIHLNYDSIAAARKMNHAWNALQAPEHHPGKSRAEWSLEFEDAIRFEERNITEIGEDRIARDIRALWETVRSGAAPIDTRRFEKMEALLDQLVEVNERGMFGWAARSHAFSRNVFLFTVAVYFLTVLIALLLADGLAVRIADPIRELSGALRRKAEPDVRLRAPRATSLEMRILTRELLALWERFSELRKLNLDQIVRQRRQLATVLASVDDGILVLDNADRVLLCNDGMLRLIGSALEEVEGRQWHDLSCTTANYLKLRALLRPEISSEQVVDIPNGGKVRAYSGRRRAILDERGEQFGSLYLLHDITEIRQRDRLKTEFIGVLSHELKTPLQSLGTAAELLLHQASQFDAEGRQLIETLNEDVGRIRGVANEFIQVGLLDLHSLRLRLERVDIGALIPQWIQPFQLMAKDRDVRIEFLKEGSDSILTRLDRVKFPWAITNLMSNAIRVSPPGGLITVQLSDREKRVDLEVRDEGPGFSDEVQFDGTSGILGIGLKITKDVVDAHGGEIRYFRREPHGSIFRVSLPLLV